MNAYLEEITLPQALALLRLTRCDTVAFVRLFPAVSGRQETQMPSGVICAMPC